jgi:hypothetical protein
MTWEIGEPSGVRLAWTSGGFPMESAGLEPVRLAGQDSRLMGKASKMPNERLLDR